MTKQHFEFANLIVRFGDKKVLLDHFEEMVFPVLIEPGVWRERGRQRPTVYRVENQSWFTERGDGGQDELIFVGRIIKDTTLFREQVYRQGRLMHDPAVMPTAPSAIFALIVNSHKLIFYPETAYAPTTEQFASAFEYALRGRWDRVVRTRAKETSRTLVEVSREMPRPSVDLIPLSHEKDIKRFLKHFSLIRKLDIDFVEPNQEFDDESTFDRLRDVKRKLRAKKARFHAESSRGLDIPETSTQIARAAASGNARFTVQGDDHGGNRLRAANEDVKVQIPFDAEKKTLVEIAKAGAESFRRAIRERLVQVGRSPESPQGRVREIVDNIKR